MRIIITLLIASVVASVAGGILITNRVHKPVVKDFSLNDTFQYHDPEAETKGSDANNYDLIVTGDIIPARSVNSKMVALNNFNYPFEKTVKLLKTGDALFINLESPLIAGCPATLEGMIFCGDPRDVEGLTYAGVTVANLANNHMGNYGSDGVKSTLALLAKNNIKVASGSEPAIINIKGKSFGFLGYNDNGATPKGLSAARPENIKTDVEALKKKVDFVIVTFHWGIEYTSDPNERQKLLAHAAVDAGADLVVGNHPHWVQGVEQYKGKYIAYALGNFIFDQMWSQETREGVVGKFTFTDKGVSSIKFFPVIIDNYSQPRYATKEEAEKILTRIKNSSDTLIKAK